MSDSGGPHLNKWPFFLGDLLLIGFAVVVIVLAKGQLVLWQGLLCVTVITLGAWLSIIPFLQQYRGELKTLEFKSLTSSSETLKEVSNLRQQILTSTSQLQNIQDQSARTVKTVEEIVSAMTNRMAEFTALLGKTDDSEKSHLRLEVEKLRRSESEWLQVTVHLLDHVFSLHKAATRSGHPTLVQQISQFQHACQDSVRRLGLAGFGAKTGDPFDERVHEPTDGHSAPGEAIEEIMALGFTFQGQLVRKALVRLSRSISDPPAGTGSVATPR